MLPKAICHIRGQYIHIFVEFCMKEIDVTSSLLISLCSLAQLIHY